MVISLRYDKVTCPLGRSLFSAGLKAANKLNVVSF